MSTTTMEPTEVFASSKNIQHCKNLIKQSVLSECKNLNKDHSVTGILSSQLLEGFHNLLLAEDGNVQDWISKIYDYKNMLQNMLILLGKPNIINLVPPYLQEDASVRIGKLLDFFQWLDDESITTLMDFTHLNFLPTEANVERVMNNYEV
jgi:hypothetical protein